MTLISESHLVNTDFIVFYHTVFYHIFYFIEVNFYISSNEVFDVYPIVL